MKLAFYAALGNTVVAENLDQVMIKLWCLVDVSIYIFFGSVLCLITTFEGSVS